MIETNDEALKQQVRDYWNAHPCGTQFTGLEWGSKKFFDEVERFRYGTQPFMRSLMEFDNFRGKRLLEIGCGLGTDLLQFARSGALVTGVDLTPASIELVQKRFAMEGLPVEARVADAENLPFADAARILAAYGFPLCRFEIVPPRQVFSAADRIGYPVVLKAHGRSIIHKSDIGGVVVGIEDRASLERALEDMRRDLERAAVLDQVDGYLVQEMAASGKEIVLGMSQDETFGPLVMFGMGGKYVEIIKDIVFRLMPVTDVDAWEMVKGIRSYPLLEGVRGEKRVDIEFIVESIQRLAQMVSDIPRLAELDLNPVIVTPERRRCRVVDFRMRLE